MGLSPRGRGNLAQHHHCRRGQRSIPAWAGEPRPDTPPNLPTGVYPRVGGGTDSATIPERRVIGLSPRGRGNLRQGVQQLGQAGSIPAWAGEPPSGLSHRPGATVYPRVGGGTQQQNLDNVRAKGLSPRGRGNLKAQGVHSLANGSIPAWAGEPPVATFLSAMSRVYPRVGGGTSQRRRHTGLGRGSIPAWAGEPR